MAKHIDYLHSDFPLEGDTCPMCGKRSWWVMKCNGCGRIFCRNCKPEYFTEYDYGDVDITCECGAETLFYDT